MGSDTAQGAPAHELPEVLHQYPPSEGLQTVPAEKILVSQSDALALGYDEKQLVSPEEHPPGKEAVDSRKGRICGLSVWLFWVLVVAIATVVIAAVVAGSVVGTSKKHRNGSGKIAASTSARTFATSFSSLPDVTRATASASSSNSRSTSITTASITSSKIPGPTPGQSLVQDCPSSNQTIYSFGATGSLTLFRKWCNWEFTDVNGATSAPNTQANSLDECIQLCASYNIQNATEIADGSSNVCNAVSWRYANTDNFLGQCFGYTTKNESGSFVGEYSDHSDSAAWINQ